VPCYYACISCWSVFFLLEFLFHCFRSWLADLGLRLGHLQFDFSYDACWCILVYSGILMSRSWCAGSSKLYLVPILCVFSELLEFKVSAWEPRVLLAFSPSVLKFLKFQMHYFLANLVSMDRSWCAGSSRLCFVPILCVFSRLLEFKVSSWQANPMTAWELRVLLACQPYLKISNALFPSEFGING
jgi:hypothetical protein